MRGGPGSRRWRRGGREWRRDHFFAGPRSRRAHARGKNIARPIHGEELIKKREGSATRPRFRDLIDSPTHYSGVTKQENYQIHGPFRGGPDARYHSHDFGGDRNTFIKKLEATEFSPWASSKDGDRENDRPGRCGVRTSSSTASLRLAKVEEYYKAHRENSPARSKSSCV